MRMSLDRLVSWPSAASAAAMLVQTTSAIGDRQRLNAVKAGQETAFQDAAKLRARLEAIAADTAKLAIDGEPAARVVCHDLRRMGIVLPAPSP